VRLVGISQDITERKQAEETLQKSYTEIEQLKDRLQVESEYLRAEIKLTHSHGESVGESEAIKKVLLQVEQVAPTESSVLITGETGTGKELIARAIHNLSKRKDRVMVKVDCASLPSALVESELFGRQKGAYTGALTSQVGRFEVADGSTIFLDEIGELSTELQAKLLRVVQDGEFERLGSPKTMRVNVRVIAATNRDLSKEVHKGNFREDLYYRLNVFCIEVPPLRERLDDIPLLAFTFVNEFAEKMGKKIQTVPKRTMESFQRYHWPGNIRELRNIIEHAVIVSTSDMLKVKLPQGVTSRILTLEDAERQHITKVLEMTNWRIKGPHGAAELLGLKPSTLYTKMNKLGIATNRNKDAIPT
jgi:transcriptional regulator with GAF, ATPase, and Fis domain